MTAAISPIWLSCLFAGDVDRCVFDVVVAYPDSAATSSIVFAVVPACTIGVYVDRSGSEGEPLDMVSSCRDVRCFVGVREGA